MISSTDDGCQLAERNSLGSNASFGHNLTHALLQFVLTPKPHLGSHQAYHVVSLPFAVASQARLEVEVLDLLRAQLAVLLALDEVDIEVALDVPLIQVQLQV